MTTATIPTTLTALDRCDRCGAAARMQAVLPSGGTLLFCGHHGHRHSVELAEIGAVLHPMDTP